MDLSEYTTSNSSDEGDYSTASGDEEKGAARQTAASQSGDAVAKELSDSVERPEPETKSILHRRPATPAPAKVKADDSASTSSSASNVEQSSTTTTKSATATKPKKIRLLLDD